MTGELIEKEQIGNYKIVAAPEDKTTALYDKLVVARRLGNEFKSKARITFQTEEGPKSVETTVWLLTDHYIQIKNGVMIPLRSILDVDF